MFRAPLCTSPGELIDKYDICYMSLYVGDHQVCRFANLHTRRSPT